ncbi:MAG: hypothetical protein HDS65_01740 [Bacteroidales bacterium]|nr:hypothetical protein [Bacteroidales bacterium]
MANDTMENNSEERDLLRYHETLDAFRDTIATYYSEKTIDVYRTVRTNPPTDADLIPQRYLNEDLEEFNELLIEYSEEEVAEMTDEEKRSEVSSNAISVNNTAEKCISSAIRTYRTVTTNHPERAEKFKKQRGPFVARLSLKPQHGLISKAKNGHRNFLLREGVKMNDIWDRSFDILEFDYDAEHDNSKE